MKLEPDIERQLRNLFIQFAIGAAIIGAIGAIGGYGLARWF